MPSALALLRAGMGKVVQQVREAAGVASGVMSILIQVRYWVNHAARHFSDSPWNFIVGLLRAILGKQLPVPLLSPWSCSPYLDYICAGRASCWIGVLG